jgi:integrase
MLVRERPKKLGRLLGVANVYKIRGKWCLDYKGPTGKRKRFVSEVKTKAAAKRMAEDLERRAERQRLGLEALPAEDGGGTVGELLEWWLKHHVEGKPSANREGPFCRKHLINSELASIRLVDLQASDVEVFLTRKAKRLSPQSLNHLRGYLSRAFNLSIREGRWKGANPISAVKKRKVPKYVADFLRADEVPRLLAATSRKYRPLFACAIYTGMRQGELVALRKSDVDLDSGMITVRRSHGRETTKGGHADVIPIHSELQPYLEEAIRLSPSQIVFPDDLGNQRPEAPKLVRVLRRALGRAGIVTGYEHRCRKRGCGYKEPAADNEQRYCPKHGHKLWAVAHPRPLRFHDLRHTTGTLLMQAGASLAAVQKILRHSDPKITTEIYGHLEQDHLRKEMERLTIVRGTTDNTEKN